MLMVENSTPVKDVNYEGLGTDLHEDTQLEVFAEKIKNCIQQIAKDPNEKTIENILNYSKTFRKL
ncbi:MULTISPECIES: hypothetical protein [Sphingobacterium]|uniref:Uncharacterized protein n=2 Tax=Sphingobacteriaceae TaxID=84566 RepID=A0ABT7NTA1_9SPHI|nr:MULTISPECIES: hypothetical protein [Sphingobacterium]MCT1526493.1 hypothetical protein [Sphingobacterium hotanense]MDM1050406.1 hypothetical protein [Sphingobacterium hotanense]